MIKQILKQIGLVFRNLIETVSPKELTVTRLTITKVRIIAYHKANGRLPSRLSELPEEPGKDNSVDDGWGKPILYTIVNPSTVILTSSGGNHDQRDMSELSITFDPIGDRSAE